MTALDTDHLAVVTGPLTLGGELEFLYGERAVFLEPGEVVRVVEGVDEDGYAYVLGLHSGNTQYIDASSLTPLSEIQDDPEVLWGETPYVVFSDIHDYVYEEEDAE